MQKFIKLSNGLHMPNLIQGIPLLRDYANHGFESFYNILKLSLDCGIRAFDTSHDYGKSEILLGKSIKRLLKKTQYRRDDIFITTKIGNYQQQIGNIEGAVDAALKTIGVDQIDLMLLHWPVPNLYEKNFQALEKMYKAGKVRSMGIANVVERHVQNIEKILGVSMFHVAQFEYHPFRTKPALVSMCKERGIAIQAYSSLLQMLPKITENDVLLELSHKYGKTIPQIVLRWDIQQNIAPIFRTYNPRHLAETADVFDFEISSDDINRVSNLNENYKLHPESMNCPGF